MACDRHEAAKRGQQRKPAAKHPFAAIDHRVIDSAPYADTSYSGRALLLQLSRQLTMPNNNGRLQATHTYLSRYGFSENTITRGIAELIEHGFIFKTRSGGFHQGAALYAVTWIGMTDNREGLFCNTFKPFAWRDWKPDQKKTRPPKLGTHSRKSGGLTDRVAANLKAVPPPKSADIELMPVHSDVTQRNGYGAWVSSYLIRLAAHGPQFISARPVAVPEVRHAA